MLHDLETGQPAGPHVETALIDSAEEITKDRVAGNKSPLEILSSLSPQDVTDGIRELYEHGVTISGHDAATLLAKEIDALAEAGKLEGDVKYVERQQILGPNDCERVTNQETENMLAVREVMPTPEVYEALKDYYNDHRLLSTAARALTQGKEVDFKAFSGDDGVLAIGMKQAVMQLEHFFASDGNSFEAARGKVEAMKYICQKMLFKECAVGATTVGDSEVALLAAVRAEVNEWLLKQDAAASQFYDTGRNYDVAELQRSCRQAMATDPEAIKAELAFVKQDFWEDARQAGQLEYHNTPFAKHAMDDDFTLRSRPNQIEHSGTAKMTTADWEGHSLSVHFSETFMTDGYKSAGRNEEIVRDSWGAQEEWSGTIAIPLADIIKTTPYARQAKYGVVQGKDWETTHKVPVKCEVMGAHNGMEDNQPSKDGLDRTFYADNTDMKQGANYNYRFGESRQGRVIVLESDQRREDNIDQLTKQYEEYGVAEAGKALKGIQTRREYGRGEHIAPVITINNSGARGEAGYDAVLTSLRQQQQEVLDDPAYKDKLVVRLRGFDMAFYSQA